MQFTHFYKYIVQLSDDFALDTDTALWLMWDFCAETFYSKLTISYRINFYSPAIRKSTKSSFADKYKIREFSQPTWSIFIDIFFTYPH